MKGCRDGASVDQVSVDRLVMGCVTSRAPIVEVRSIVRFTQGQQEFNVRNVELPQPTPHASWSRRFGVVEIIPASHGPAGGGYQGY